MSANPQQFQSYGGMPYGSVGGQGGQQGGPAGGRFYNTVQVARRALLCCGPGSRDPGHNP
jgi:hypothetical protein